VTLEPRRRRLHALRAEGSGRVVLSAERRVALGAAWAVVDPAERLAAVAAALEVVEGAPWTALRSWIAARRAWEAAIADAPSLDELRAAYADTRAIDDAAIEVEAPYPAAERYGMRVIPRDGRLALVPHAQVQEVPAALVGEPWAEDLGELVFCGDEHGWGRGRFDESARRLAAGAWPLVRRLVIGGTGLTAAGVATLASSALGRGLTELDLSWEEVGADGARAIAELAGLARLRLEFAVQQDPAAAVAALGRGALRGLRSLALDNNGLDPAAVAALVDGPLVRGLAELSIAGTREAFSAVGDDGADRLARCEALRGLQILSLQGNEIGPAGARALAASPALEGLQRLDLRGNPLCEDDEAVEALVERFGDRVRT
jgi:hypothetical protein